MTRRREPLPQLSGTRYLTDGGVETHLIFNEGHELPQFCAFVLNDSEAGREAMRDYYRAYLPIARRAGLPFLFDTNTWRANPDWGALVGYDASGLSHAIRTSVSVCEEVAAEFASEGVSSIISGMMGPRRDAWKYDAVMTIGEAVDYHAPQIEIFADTSAAYVTCLTLTNVPEGVGIARAAEAAGMPVVLSFTLETDGNLPGGKLLREAISETDDLTGGYPAYYMINCAHPVHFDRLAAADTAGLARVMGLRTNASAKSHAELDESPTLDRGDPQDLARRYAGLLGLMPQIRVIGGCCGTDHHHISAVVDQLAMQTQGPR
ncbi:homocysteine S-methyltransferase family protein [Devosia sp.]|uniref:homocysteine S-methyltransferase family protein n=1 Tax=Devosia sp. TaxID=1871048 RepID=UPI003BA87DE0